MERERIRMDGRVARVAERLRLCQPGWREDGHPDANVTLPRGRSAPDLVGLALAALLAGAGIHAWLANGRAPERMALASTGGRPASISAR